MNASISKILKCIKCNTHNEMNGAPDMIRTRDTLITNQVLYQLSYKGNEAPIAQTILK